MAVTGRLELDTAKLGRELRDRNGAVGRVMAGFAGLATVEVRDVARDRIESGTGEYIDKISSTVIATQLGPAVRVTAGAPHSRYLEAGTRPHVIVPRRARVLRFETRGGDVVFTRRVNHPGTSAKRIVRDGVIRAGRKLTQIT